MKALAVGLSVISVSVLFPGCATEVRDPKTGNVVFRTHGDAVNMTYTGPGYAFHASQIIHSTHTAKAIQSAATLSTTIGAAVSGVIKP